MIPNKKLNIVGVAFLIGLAVAAIDIILDYYCIKEPDFVNLLIVSVPRHELYSTLIKLVLFLIFGIILSQYIEKVEQTERRYQQLFSNLNEAIFVMPLSDDFKLENFVEVNPMGCKSLGYSKDELLHLSLQDVTAPENSTDILSLIRKIVAERYVLFETVMLSKDGIRVPVEINSHLFSFAGKATVLLIVRDITVRQQSEARLLAKKEQLSILTAQLLNVQEIERGRMARELHDELGQSMMFLKFKLSYICDIMPDGHELLANECEQLLRYVDDTIDNIRRFAIDLSPTLLDDLGLSSAIRLMVEDFGKKINITSSTDIDDVDNLLSPQVQLNIYRIFQESLTNISKHSHATNVSCLLKKRAGHIYIEVQDNGKGFDVTDVLSHRPKLKRFGLATINERVRLIGGALEVQSQEGSGTRISFTVPLDEGKSDAALSNLVS